MSYDSCIINSLKKTFAPEIVPFWLKNRTQRVRSQGRAYVGGDLYEVGLHVESYKCKGKGERIYWELIDIEVYTVYT